MARNSNRLILFCIIVLLFLLTPVCSLALPPKPTETPAVTVGIVTDVHIEAMGDYDGRATCLTNVVNRFNAVSPDFVIELGDAVNARGSEAEIISEYEIFESIYSDLTIPRYYVLGNHECEYDEWPDTQIAATLWMEHTGATACYYSFDVGNFHFVVLENAQIPVNGGQLNWLKNDLAASNKMTLVFIHCPVAEDLQQALADDSDLRAVFCGHLHTNRHSVVNGIDYYVLAHCYWECSSCCSLLSIYPDGSISLEGFGFQKSYVNNFSEQEGDQAVMKEANGLSAKILRVLTDTCFYLGIAFSLTLIGVFILFKKSRKR
jgi:predicted phosphodiesterase